MSDESDQTLEGGCTCGALRYQMTCAPMFVNCCHCHWCQRETGSCFAVNAAIEADRVTVLQGRSESVETPSNSGSGQKIVRCPTCRIAVWSHYKGGGDAISYIRVGTLDDADRLTPNAHIFIRSKHSWIVLPTDIPAFQEFYDREDVWPANSLARWHAARG